jgi:acyl-CoA synthetase (AMP-forming)/AMP-acid ligase II
VTALPPFLLDTARALAVLVDPLRDDRARHAASGGKIPQNILEQMTSVFPDTQIFLMYGLTEAFRSTYLAPSRFLKKMGSIGRAIPGSEVYVIKHGVGVAGPGEQGELVHRGPLVCQGLLEPTGGQRLKRSGPARKLPI